MASFLLHTLSENTLLEGQEFYAATIYKAPTVGLNSMVFKVDHVMDAVDFADNKTALERYCAVNCKIGGALIQKASKDMSSPTFTPQTDPETGASMVKIKKWKMEYDAYDKGLNAWDDAKDSSFQMVLQHCHPNLEHSLKLFVAWEATNTTQE